MQDFVRWVFLGDDRVTGHAHRVHQHIVGHHGMLVCGGVVDVPQFWLTESPCQPREQYHQCALPWFWCGWMIRFMHFGSPNTPYCDKTFIFEVSRRSWLKYPDFCDRSIKTVRTFVTEVSSRLPMCELYSHPCSVLQWYTYTSATVLPVYVWSVFLPR